MMAAIDSNALTYLLQAMEPGYDPAMDNTSLAMHRLAMLRSYLYAEQYFYILPEVAAEYHRISNRDWWEVHDHLVGTLLHEVDWPLPKRQIGKRRDFFLSHHSKNSDCLALAEAEAAGMSTFLTRDDKFIRKLRHRTTVLMQYPLEFWQTFKISAGAIPRITPHPTNALSRQSWWRL